MRLVGIEEFSLVDWDDRVSAVVFVAGCNLLCPFCHNHRVADDDPGLPTLDIHTLIQRIEKLHHWLSGIVITGGEPLMHPELPRLCQQLKSLGFKLKLDTNGTFPYRLEQLLANQLVDYVAMDIKAPLNDKYSVACGVPVDLAVIRRAIRTLLKSRIPHEFRTTLVPGIIEEADMLEMGHSIAGAPAVYLQPYVPEHARSVHYRNLKPYTRAQAESMAERIRPLVRQVRLRGRFD